MYKLNMDIPTCFFNKEERCGYYVSPEMKKVWAVLLDMLNEVARICDEYNIKWFADGGTMLGAVRHGGFIPWDDDVDVRMLRPDYDRFVEVAQQELKYPYFFQTEQTDPGSLRCHAQIRNSETTGMLKGEVDINYTFNQGIFLDIFPLDNITDDDCLVRQQIVEIRQIIASLKNKRYFPYVYWKRKRRNVVAWLFNCVRAWWLRTFCSLSDNWDVEFEKVHEIMTRYQNQNTKKVGHLCLLRYNENLLFLREDYDEVVYMPFEMLKIPVPKNYDRVLSDQYGDWRKPQQAPSCHGGVIFDTERPYNIVLKEIASVGLDEWMKNKEIVEKKSM